MSLTPGMRRVIVIFLILLFPLNVFALSLSAATLAQSVDVAERVHALAAQADAAADDTGDAGDDSCEHGCDIDPDEPPAGADLHYIVGHHGGLHFAGPATAAPPLHDAAPRCHSIAPPIKPPRAA